VFDAFLFVYLFAAAAEVVGTEFQPVRMSPYKTVADRVFRRVEMFSLLHCRMVLVLFEL